MFFHKKGFTVVELIITVTFLSTLIIGATVIAHFLMKFW